MIWRSKPTKHRIALGLAGSARDKAAAFVDSKKRDVGHVVVTGPEGARLFVSERNRGSLPLSRPLVLFAGKQTLRVALGQQSVTRQVDVPAGGSTRLDFGTTLEPPAAPTAPAPAAAASSAPGAAPPITPVTPHRKPRDRTLPWALTLGGAGLAVAGGVSVIAASSSLSNHRDSLSGLCAVPVSGDACSLAKSGQRANAQNEVDSIATWKAVRSGGFVGLGVGLVAAGVGAVWLLSASDSEPRTGLSVSPLAGGASLSVFGRM